MTVMIDRFFGVSQHVVWSGLWKKMKPGEKDMYVFLLAKSERYCTRELTCSDAEIAQTVGVRPRTICNARKKLQEHGLICCIRKGGNKYRYAICDPTTDKPYAGDPTRPVVCRIPKRTKTGGLEPDSGHVATVVDNESNASANGVSNGNIRQYGAPGVFERSE